MKNKRLGLYGDNSEIPVEGAVIMGLIRENGGLRTEIKRLEQSAVDLRKELMIERADFKALKKLLKKEWLERDV